MFDAGLARPAAGGSFRRADSERDERASEPLRPFEDFLRNLAGWLPPGRLSRRAVNRLEGAVDEVASGLRDAPDERIADCLHSTVRGLRGGGDPAGLVPVLACLALASERRLGLRPHAVQLAGARALLAGRLAEMQTGEGKTLVAAIAATVLAASGAAVHVISTNDYLARRDAEEMAALFAFFGLGTGFIEAGMSAEQRRAAYAQPVCYVAGKEVVFDYLKDRLAGHGLLPARVSRLHGLLAPRPAAEPLIPALHCAIVDEADSVMIDEARTPMILSQPAPPLFDTALLDWAIDSARRLEAGRDFRVGAGRRLELDPQALAKAAPLPALAPPAWQAPAWREQLLRQALTALHLYHRDQQYIVSEGKVQIVDESSGRVMPDRSWEQGLHQLIEAKEGIELTQGRETLARMTYQRFFRRYYLLSGLTGTAAEAARELWSVYRLRVLRLPPNRPKQLTLLAERCLPGAEAKWAAVAAAAITNSAQGRPVLIGTRSVQASEQVSAALALAGVAHVVLNARQDAEEARIVARAGCAGQITVATNMAGRGTDIRLDPQALAAGGLHVILTEYHESPRIDRQLFGRCARQGQPGSVQAIVAASDTIWEHQPRLLRRLMQTDGGVGRLALRWLRRRAQDDAERRAYIVRLETFRHDRELHRLIGFAGRVT
jgi:preprotein translocase subunit SecA